MYHFSEANSSAFAVRLLLHTTNCLHEHQLHCKQVRKKYAQKERERERLYSRHKVATGMTHIHWPHTRTRICLYAAPDASFSFDVIFILFSFGEFITFLVLCVCRLWRVAEYFEWISQPIEHTHTHDEWELEKKDWRIYYIVITMTTTHCSHVHKFISCALFQLNCLEEREIGAFGFFICHCSVFIMIFGWRDAKSSFEQKS